MGVRRPGPARQRPRHQRHVRTGCPERDNGGPEWHDRRGDRREALARHRRRARRAVEWPLHGEPAHRGHVSLGGDRREETGRSMSAPVRVAVVGAGAIAQVAHLPVLRKLPGVEVAAICDNDVAKAQALAEAFEVKATFGDIEEVLRYSHADVVAICTPNHLQEIHGVAALAAGCHVLCERPLALTVAGVERVLRASEKYGKRVMVGMNHRFRSDVQAVRGFLAGGDLGALQAIRSGWYTFQPSRQQLGWRLRRPEAGGGAFLDLGLQLFDLGLWLAGWPAPKCVAAHMEGQAKDSVEVMATALVACEHGTAPSMARRFRCCATTQRFLIMIQ